MKQAGLRILILPEGWCEYFYAMALKNELPRDKQRGIGIEIPKPDGKTTALQLLHKALQAQTNAKRERNTYDAIWLFFDHDNQPQLGLFFESLLKTDIKMAYSSLCIEHWFIMHLVDDRSPNTSSAQVIAKLDALWQKHFKQAYHKTKLKHFEILKPYLPQAMQRAEAISRQAEGDGPALAALNPYFTLPAFIRYFRSL